MIVIEDDEAKTLAINLDTIDYIALNDKRLELYGRSRPAPLVLRYEHRMHAFAALQLLCSNLTNFISSLEIEVYLTENGIEVDE